MQAVGVVWHEVPPEKLQPASTGKFVAHQIKAGTVFQFVTVLMRLDQVGPVVADIGLMPDEVFVVVACSPASKPSSPRTVSEQPDLILDPVEIGDLTIAAAK